MKNIILIISLTLFLKPIFPVLEYVINYDYIANVLCKNKDKPALECNGKCHLTKELATASENEKPISPNKKNTRLEIEILFFTETFTCDFLNKNWLIIKSINTYYLNLYTHLYTKFIFHPPII